MAFLDLPKNQIAWDAFWILNATREVGMGGACALQVSEIRSALEMMGVKDGSQMIRLARYVVGMDLKWRDWQAQAQKGKGKG